METHDVGRIFVTRCKVNRGIWPLVQKATSHELTRPFRIGNGAALRVGPETGIAIGWWGPPRSVDAVQVSGEIGDPWHEAEVTDVIREQYTEDDGWVIEDLTEILQEATGEDAPEGRSGGFGSAESGETTAQGYAYVCIRDRGLGRWLLVRHRSFPIGGSTVT